MVQFECPRVRNPLVSSTYVVQADPYIRGRDSRNNIWSSPFPVFLLRVRSPFMQGETAEMERMKEENKPKK